MSRQQPGPQGSQGQQQNGASGPQAADPQEQAAYDGAIDLFRKAQYKEASESLSAFTALYPNSD